MYKITAIFTTLLLFTPFTIQAAEDETYYGVKIGTIDPSISAYDTASNINHHFDPVSSIGFLVGYKFDDNLYIEGEGNTNIGEGEISSFDFDLQTPIDNKWDITTLSVNGLYKSSGKAHLRLKVGLTHTSINYSDTVNLPVGLLSDSTTDLSYAIGMGFNTSSGKEFVIEWTYISEQIPQFITFGINF